MTSRTLLHLNTERGWRGGEVQTLLLARGLQARGHRCHLAVPPGSPLEERGLEEGLSVTPLPARGEMDPFAVARLARLIGRLRIDLLHYHTSHAVTLGTLASFLAGRRKAVASRRVSFPLDRNPLAKLKYTLRLDRIIAVSDGIRRILEAAGVPRDRVTVIPSAVDLRRFDPPRDREACRRELGLGESDFAVGAVGALAGHKGHRILVKAAERILASNPGFRFLIAGRGEEEAALRGLIAAAGMEGKFRLIGFRERVETFLPALDLFAFPSLSGEGSPAVLKEAMACGLPVVATEISGVREVVRPGEEGILVPPGDPEALAAGLMALAADGERRSELARRGRDRARVFSVELMVERTESLYREILGEPSAGGGRLPDPGLRT